MDTKGTFIVTRDRPAGELVQQRLQDIPSRFGRLVYLARCLDGHGRYRHEGLNLTHDRTTVDRALAAAHETCFGDWLSLPLREQHADFDAFLEGLNRRRALTAWAHAEPWPALAPRSAGTDQKELFASDLRVLIADFAGSL
jgi:hypothetical protein